MKPIATNVAARAVELATGPRIGYNELDCQAFVEQCVRDCGGKMAYAGSNDMARNAVAWLGTLANAKAEGKLVPGAGLMIHEDDGGEPKRYRADGLGNFSHVGFYVGANALRDADQNGAERACDVVHSSATMGRVAGSTLQNGWTHVIWFKELDYGEAVGETVEKMTEATEAVVFSDNRQPVRVRPTPSTQKPWVALLPVGTRVTVYETANGWARVGCPALGDGTGYMQSRFLTDAAAQAQPDGLPARVAELENRLYLLDVRLSALEGGAQA